MAFSFVGLLFVCVASPIMVNKRKSSTYKEAEIFIKWLNKKPEIKVHYTDIKTERKEKLQSLK